MLQVRWLGRVTHPDAHALQSALFRDSANDYLLLLEHPHTFTLGLRAKPEHILVDPQSVGAIAVKTNRGGDVTYHGPGQLVGYPILSLPMGHPLAATPAYVHSVEDVIIDVLLDLGLSDVGRLPDYPGVWVGVSTDAPRKIAAVGVRNSRGRTMHGFALNINPDLSYFEHIVPCGIHEFGVTSLANEGIDVSMQDVVERVIQRGSAMWSNGKFERQSLAVNVTNADLAAFSRGEGIDDKAEQTRSTPVRLINRMTRAGITTEDALDISTRKPEWLRVKANMGQEYRELKKSIRDLGLVTVCEEAGCPNIFECWKDGTATFMALGERCTRACGFCLVDTQKPMAPDENEPEQIAAAIEKMQVHHGVITMVARDDLPDGGANHIARIIETIRLHNPITTVEVLISDMKGSAQDLQVIFDARPDVLNHNVETVLRLQRVVRPSASYTRSLAVLARAKEAGLVTKSGFMLGLGESDDEVISLLRDMRAIGIDIVTIGQYLRPTVNHLPVMRWYEPDEFTRYAEIGQEMGFSHVQSSPLTRSSYHAREAALSSTQTSSN